VWTSLYRRVNLGWAGMLWFLSNSMPASVCACVSLCFGCVRTSFFESFFKKSSWMLPWIANDHVDQNHHCDQMVLDSEMVLVVVVCTVVPRVHRVVGYLLGIMHYLVHHQHHVVDAMSSTKIA